MADEKEAAQDTDASPGGGPLHQTNGTDVESDLIGNFERPERVDRDWIVKSDDSGT